jgi:hypothetical protein
MATRALRQHQDKPDHKCGEHDRGYRPAQRKPSVVQELCLGSGHPPFAACKEITGLGDLSDPGQLSQKAWRNEDGDRLPVLGATFGGVCRVDRYPGKSRR